ncbi:tryptophan synthase subunit alpha [Candidatus Tremblaya phenacola]|uniref:Tryptophan synthase alpha chain n=1 Tax=Candidatus Tremblayella phenacoccinincola TaxID=1010676 RepID=A0A2G0V7A9_9PROT|nr:tryptophan synthase subunit alpha [Candidatus Tremblaya phenacola]PHN16348.1 Tryptophan synthase alpha chain [Candidatus Tremblaya phenacola]
MKLNRYREAFYSLFRRYKTSFIVFNVIGEPNQNRYIKVVSNFILSGIVALELGIPFSDPLADGPTIQRAAFRVINIGIKPFNCFKSLAVIRHRFPYIPIGLLMYSNLVFNIGIRTFCSYCSYIKADSIIIVDMPLEESRWVYRQLVIYLLYYIYICPPLASLSLLKKVVLCSSLYIYLLSKLGITGIEANLKLPLVNSVKGLGYYYSVPILQGFGIFSYIQVVSLLKNKISGFIAGSVVINIIENNIYDSLYMINLLYLFLVKLSSYGFS